CVLSGIAKHSAMLKDGATDQERGEALFFLGHWLGDVPQPLHVSFASDQGGNLVQPITRDFYPIPKTFPLSLHSVRDRGIIRKALADSGWRALADNLQKKITDAQRTEWLAVAALRWGEEASRLTPARGVVYGKH